MTLYEEDYHPSEIEVENRDADRDNPAYRAIEFASDGNSMDDSHTGVAPRTDLVWSVATQGQDGLWLIKQHYLYAATNFISHAAMIKANREAFPDLYKHL